jgi:hypothetical protein
MFSELLSATIIRRWCSVPRTNTVYEYMIKRGFKPEIVEFGEFKWHRKDVRIAYTSKEDLLETTRELEGRLNMTKEMLYVFLTEQNITPIWHRVEHSQRFYAKTDTKDLVQPEIKYPDYSGELALSIFQETYSNLLSPYEHTKASSDPQEVIDHWVHCVWIARNRIEVAQRAQTLDDSYSIWYNE